MASHFLGHRQGWRPSTNPLPIHLRPCALVHVDEGAQGQDAGGVAKIMHFICNEEGRGLCMNWRVI